MKILALDTSTELCSAALLVDGKSISRELETERGAAEHILPMIDSLLAEAGLALGAVEAIAFGRGPGGFTGVRLAASVTQGLAFGAGLPVIPVSDLAAVARRALDIDAAGSHVLVCNDARMKEVYWACFARDEGAGGTGGALRLSGTEHVGPADQVLPPEAGAGPAGTGHLIGAGRGFQVYPQLVTRVSRAYDALLPRAVEVAMLAAGAPRLAPEQAIPVYIRDDVARPAP